jgi:hypothetical protein
MRSWTSQPSIGLCLISLLLSLLPTSGEFVSEFPSPRVSFFPHPWPYRLGWPCQELKLPPASLSGSWGVLGPPTTSRWQPFLKLPYRIVLCKTELLASCNSVTIRCLYISQWHFLLIKADYASAHWRRVNYWPVHLIQTLLTHRTAWRCSTANLMFYFTPCRRGFFASIISFSSCSSGAEISGTNSGKELPDKWALDPVRARRSEASQ